MVQKIVFQALIWYLSWFNRFSNCWGKCIHEGRKTHFVVQRRDLILEWGKHRSGEFPTQKLRSFLLLTQSWTILPPGIGQNIAMHVSSTACDVFLILLWTTVGVQTCRHYMCTACMRIIIIMEICKAPTLRLKALNKHTHIMHIEMEMLSHNISMNISTSVQA